jgi:hypothetical protein
LFLRLLRKRIWSSFASRDRDLGGRDLRAMLVIYRGDRVNVTNFAFLAVAILLAAIVAVVYFRSRAVALP